MNMKNSKRLPGRALSVLLSMAMCLSMLQLTAFAAEDNPPPPLLDRPW